VTPRPFDRGLAILLGMSGLGVLAVGGMATSPDLEGGTPPEQARHQITGGGPGALAFPDGPPARVTGGFGEDSCQSCHWDGEVNEGPGELTVSGFPSTYEAGERYELSITLRHPELATAGFQLAIRGAEDEGQAGAFEVAGPDDDRVGILEDREVHFVHQTAVGSEPSSEKKSSWRVHWTAPGSSAARLLLHASAVAGDGDFSQMGDAVYSLELASDPPDHR
jgi:hypothetical protein